VLISGVHVFKQESHSKHRAGSATTLVSDRDTHLFYFGPQVNVGLVTQLGDDVRDYNIERPSDLAPRALANLIDGLLRDFNLLSLRQSERRGAEQNRDE
jgi:hypothetical protein